MSVCRSLRLSRTGFIAALVLGALGASREAIMADYLESNAHLDHNIAVLDIAAVRMTLNVIVCHCVWCCACT
jgi:protein tyrosine/serine phosphatase